MESEKNWNKDNLARSGESIKMETVTLTVNGERRAVGPAFHQTEGHCIRLIPTGWNSGTTHSFAQYTYEGPARVVQAVILL